MNRWLHLLRSSGPTASRTRKATALIKYAQEISILRSGLLLTMLFGGLVNTSWGQSPQDNQETAGHLTQISLEDLGNIEVTTTSKEPVKARETPAAIYVITQEDIRRSGATSIPELLRLAPGIEVARIDSNTWSVGVRGFGSAVSRAVLVLIDGRSVYTPLFAGVWWQVQDTLLDLYNGDVGQSVGITTYSPPYFSNVEQNAELSGGNLVGRWKRLFSATSDVQLETYYDRTSRRQASFAETRDTFDVDFIHHFSLPGRQNFLWGLGSRFSSGNALPVVPTVIFTPNSQTDKLYSAFLQDEIPIAGDRLSLTIGSKFLHNNYSGFEIEPSARLLWKVKPQQTVWAAITRAVRTPSRIDEDLQLTAFLSSNPLTFFRIVGDRKFSSEDLIGYETGYRSLVRPNLYLDIAAFYNDYTHLQSIEPGVPFLENSPSPSHVVLPFLFRNALLGKTAGFEIAPDWTPTHWWRLRGSYSYLHMDLSKTSTSQDASTARSAQGSSPQHQVLVQSSLDFTRRFALDQTLRYVSALPAQQVRAYVTADAGFTWRARTGLNLSIVGQNLLQPHHAEYAGDPGAVGIKRGIYGKITWQTGQR